MLENKENRRNKNNRPGINYRTGNPNYRKHYISKDRDRKKEIRRAIEDKQYEEYKEVWDE